MEIMSFKTNNLTACGRIYLLLSQENASFFVINCLFCNKDYSEWLEFYEHLQQYHHLEKVSNIKNKGVTKIEVTEKIQLEESLISEYLVDENYCNKKKDIFKERPLEKALKYSNEEFLEEYLIEDYAEYKGLLTEKCAKVRETLKPISTCFFRLYSTDSKIILKFIELLRQHPWQWDHKHFYFINKDKREESTLNLTKQLNETLDLNITPQGTRASVLTLLRWFDSEYIRYLKCQQNNFQFICMLSEYFHQLLEFLPYQHLKPMTCDECSKHFKSEHLLMAHKHKYHNGQVPFRCRYCGHGFIHQSSHKMHENRHIKIHVWPCKICKYQATSKSDYIKHLATHSSEQPHKCTICGLAYKTKTNLNVHLKSHSLPAYECEFCKKKFYEKYRYKRHIWKHEEHDRSERSIDNFTCEICGRRFTTNKNLMKHQLVHKQENYNIGEEQSSCCRFIDEIVYFCEFCSLELIHKEAYETHMNLKHNIHNYE